MTLAEWSRDPACNIGERTLGHWVQAGWPSEQALTEPSRRTDPAYTIGRVTQRLSAWARDQHCTVSLRTVKRRIASGVDVERAVFLPPAAPRRNPARGANGSRRRPASPAHAPTAPRQSDADTCHRVQPR